MSGQDRESYTDTQDRESYLVTTDPEHPDPFDPFWDATCSHCEEPTAGLDAQGDVACKRHMEHGGAT